MNKKLFRYIAYACGKDAELKCPNFKNAVIVEHDDGSYFHFNHAFFEEKDNMLIVYSEHHQPIVFFKEDLLKVEYTNHRISSSHS